MKPMIWPHQHHILFCHQKSIYLSSFPITNHRTGCFLHPHPRPSLQHWNGCVLPAPGCDTCCSHRVTSIRIVNSWNDASIRPLKTPQQKRLGRVSFCWGSGGVSIFGLGSKHLRKISSESTSLGGLKFPPNIWPESRQSTSRNKNILCILMSIYTKCLSNVQHSAQFSFGKKSEALQY